MNNIIYNYNHKSYSHSPKKINLGAGYKHLDYQDNFVTEKIRKGFIKNGKSQKMHNALNQVYILSRENDGVSPYEYYMYLTSESLPISKYINIRMGRQSKKHFLMLGSRKLSVYKNLILQHIKNLNGVDGLPKKLLVSLNHFRNVQTKHLTIYSRKNRMEFYTTKSRKRTVALKNRILQMKRLRVRLVNFFIKNHKEENISPKLAKTTPNTKELNIKKLNRIANIKKNIKVKIIPEGIHPTKMLEKATNTKKCFTKNDDVKKKKNAI